MIRGILPHPPRFLTRDEVLTLHETSLDLYGGSYGLRDAGLLESAIAMPQQQYGGAYLHEVPFAMASAYGFHLCKNHPFVDGNKRAGFGSMVTFLRLNGWELTVSDDDAGDVFVRVASGEVGKDALTEWLMHHSRPRPSIELREFFTSLEYSELAETFRGIASGAQLERVATILEASQAIPAINAANIEAMSAENAGDARSAEVLRQHSMLLTAIFRIAEHNGYEW